MLWNLLPALGGIGLFLIGNAVDDGRFEGVAGARLRDILGRFTSTPFSGAVTGAVHDSCDPVFQRDDCRGVGFVASGLLTFPQALGIIFGAISERP